VLLEALRDSLDHVRDQRAGETVERAVLAALGRSRDDDLALALLDLHPRRDDLVQLAERPVDLNAPRGDRDIDGARNLDGLSTDSTH
jgi:hypothetical protein